MTPSPSQTLAGKTIVADAFHAPTRGQVEFLPAAAITLDPDGVIAKVSHDIPDDAIHLPAGHVLLPGLVDLHVHAPQFPQLGSALDVPLEDWLQTYTFPLEARYSDTDFAASVYAALIDHMLRAGTTTALHFATIHLPATRILADICMAKGQRALIGKVAMDHPDTCPDYYRDADADTSVAETRALIDYINHHPDNADRRVLPVITPRFVPACTDACLHGLGALALETGTRVQTHVSESDWEHAHVFDRMGMSDTETLDHFGLLRDHTVLAHANFLSGTDMDLIAARGGGIAHCPWSNIYFANAVFPLRDALARGLRVGLGTDISGGPIGTVWEAARMSVAAARMLESGTDPARAPQERGRDAARIDIATAFHLATRGGAQALGLDVGSFEVGMRFDAIAIDPAAPLGQIVVYGETPPLQLLEKIIYGATKANVARVWSDGIQRI
ncbi:amidohydrolase family protein [Roseicitreum antarcticum]|uniref:Guanine deaminase n=1 Tax=Roseicitreum antarcticum TaxID=564137 RepID=A0A1H2TU44_9RHOB|nr:amidohydrolase family protein [Roseicitreum antarcticum]SDW47287.1 guanine deaminase [Roseicitreum antarcticum]